MYLVGQSSSGLLFSTIMSRVTQGINQTTNRVRVQRQHQRKGIKMGDQGLRAQKKS